MAMSNAIRKEVNKQRELLWHFLEGEKCFFCHQLLVPKTKIEFGNGYAQPIAELLTIHHKNEDHGDNRKCNRKLAHQSCHKSHHAKIVFKAYNNGMTVAEARRNRVVGTAVSRGKRAA